MTKMTIWWTINQKSNQESLDLSVVQRVKAKNTMFMNNELKWVSVRISKKTNNVNLVYPDGRNFKCLLFNHS